MYACSESPGVCRHDCRCLHSQLSVDVVDSFGELVAYKPGATRMCEAACFLASATSGQATADCEDGPCNCRPERKDMNLQPCVQHVCSLNFSVHCFLVFCCTGIHLHGSCCRLCKRPTAQASTRQVTSPHGSATLSLAIRPAPAPGLRFGYIHSVMAHYCKVFVHKPCHSFDASTSDATSCTHTQLAKHRTKPINSDSGTRCNRSQSHGKPRRRQRTVRPKMQPSRQQGRQSQSQSGTGRAALSSGTAHLAKCSWALTTRRGASWQLKRCAASMRWHQPYLSVARVS